MYMFTSFNKLMDDILYQEVTRSSVSIHDILVPTHKSPGTQLYIFFFIL